MESETIRKCLIGVVLIGVILLGYMAISWINPTHPPLVFVTGEKEGLYRELGDAIVTEIQRAHPKIKIQVVATAGSLDNAKRLQNKTADLALYLSTANYQSHHAQAARLTYNQHLLCLQQPYH